MALCFSIASAEGLTGLGSTVASRASGDSDIGPFGMSCSARILSFTTWSSSFSTSPISTSSPNNPCSNSVSPSLSALGSPAANALLSRGLSLFVGLIGARLVVNCPANENPPHCHHHRFRPANENPPHCHHHRFLPLRCAESWRVVGQRRRLDPAGQ